MLTTRFGIEIEFTGMTRKQAAEVTAAFLNGTVETTFDGYDTRKIHTPDGRTWKIMSDASIRCEKKT
ncbi:MAG: amidoligase family protein, partial [Saccharofermentanales bacterium]